MDIINSAKHDGGGPIDWIYNAYTIRGWRPILFPVIALPLFAFFPNAPLVFLVNCFSAIVLFFILFYLRKLLQNFLTPLELCLTLILAGTLPWFNRSVVMFMCEPLFMLTALIAVYYIYRSQGFTFARYSFFAGVSTGLAFTIRPMESMLVLLPVGVIFLGLCIKERKIPVSALLVSLPSLGVLVLSLIYCIRIYPANVSIGTILFMTCSTLILAILPWIASLKLMRSWRGWISFYVSAFSISVAWALPYIKKMFNWGHMVLFDYSQDLPYAFKPGQGFSFVLVKAWSNFFGYSMSIFLFLGVVTVIMWLISRDRTKRIPYQTYWMAVMLGSIFIHPFAAPFSNDNTSRVYQLEALVLTLMCLVAVFRLKNNVFSIRKVGIFLIIIVAIFHCSVILAECGSFGAGVRDWSQKHTKRWGPRFSELWAADEKWYEPKLYTSLIEKLPNPGYGLNALVVEPSPLYAQRFVLKAERAGVMTTIKLGGSKATQNECIGRSSCDWILIGPLEIEEFGKDPNPNFMLLVQEFERNFQPQTIVIREGDKTATFLFRRLGTVAKN
ncbi:MAG: hypothetical protein HQL24_07760 [Candidatus Omnitrophica bacterium]|nr:hypothetical protein [Candidatus Omnitrophota bacterium]